MMMTCLRSGENLKPSTFPPVFDSWRRFEPSGAIVHISPPLWKAMVCASIQVGSVSLLADVLSCRWLVPSLFMMQTTWRLLFCFTE